MKIKRSQVSKIISNDEIDLDKWLDKKQLAKSKREKLALIKEVKKKLPKKNPDQVLDILIKDINKILDDTGYSAIRGLESYEELLKVLKQSLESHHLKKESLEEFISNIEKSIN